MHKRTLLVAASAVALTAALAGCSSGGASTPSGSPSASAPTNAGASSAPVYTAADLVTIATATEKKLGVSGSIKDDAALKALAGKAASGGIASLLSQAGATFSPAACSDLITKNLGGTPAGAGIGASLTYNTTTIAFASEPGKSLPAAMTDFSSKLDDVIAKCGAMKLSIKAAGQSVTVGLTLKKSTVTTDADSTYGLTETVKLPTGAAAVTVDVIEAVKGNLVIMAISPSTSSGPSATDAINAAVAASKGVGK